MRVLGSLAVRSAWHRRFVLSLVCASIAMSTFLLLGIERIRSDVRENFAQSVSGTDLIVGARTGAVELLLYSVFRIGSASNNIRWSSVGTISSHPAVDWVIPISLGDSHRGYPVVATSPAYFERFRYGDRQPLALAQGRRFERVFEVVIGSEVARQLGYAVGSRIVLSHGDGAFAANDHADKPFTVVGTLAATGTPVDRSVHIGLDSMEAIHVDWLAGAPLPGRSMRPEGAARQELTPQSVTAVLVGLKNRTAVFAVQRFIADRTEEPLLAILPGVALDELWSVLGAGERAMAAMGLLVAVVSLAGLVATLAAGLNERRRELAILRAVGAGPSRLLGLVALEGGIVTLFGVACGWLLCLAATAVLGPWFATRFGVPLSVRPPGPTELALLSALVVGGFAAGLVPGLRAYRLSLADGLSPPP